MKRKQPSRAMRHGSGKRPDHLGESKYARKVRSGNQMYGPGCCGHRFVKHNRRD